MRRSQFRNSNSARGPVHSPVTPLRLVLVGKTGSGKSATGNTILEEKRFPSKLSMSSVTKQCQKECGEVEGRRLELIDTPGCFDTSLKDKEITEEVLRCMAMCSPGPHAFLLIIPLARFTEEQQKTVEIIQEVFKENISNHTIIVFTHADELEGETIEEFISEQDQRIQDLIARFGGHFLAFNNKNPENRDQVKQLLKKLDELLEQNQHRHFTNQNSEAVEKALALLEQKKQEKLEESIKKTKQEVRNMAEGRKADIMKSMEEDKQEMERHRKYIQDKILYLKKEIDNKNQCFFRKTQKLQSLKKSLKRKKNSLKKLEKEKEMRIKESERKQKQLEIWINEEEKRREQEKREKASHDDESKWYNNELYFSILKYLFIFLGGAGVRAWLAPLVYSTAAPVGLAAELTAQLGPEFAAIVMAKAARLTGLATNVAPLVAGLCSIQ